MNAQLITWHLVEDVLGWVSILIVSIVLMLKDIYILDPILSILITCYILFNVIKNLGKTVSVFLQAVPAKKIFSNWKLNSSLLMVLKMFIMRIYGQWMANIISSLHMLWLIRIWEKLNY